MLQVQRPHLLIYFYSHPAIPYNNPSLQKDVNKIYSTIHIFAYNTMSSQLTCKPYHLTPFPTQPYPTPTLLLNLSSFPFPFLDLQLLSIRCKVVRLVTQYYLLMESGHPFHPATSHPLLHL